MGFKTGLIVGFAAGYYLGTQAGRERYEQINEWLEQVRQSDPVTTATERVKEVIDGGDSGPAASTSTGTTDPSSN